MAHRLLTLEQIRNAAPSVFANNPFPGVSDRYAFLPTAGIVEQMMGEGWGVREASESYVRTSERKGFQKHMIRFARVEDIERVNNAMQVGVHRIDRKNPLARFPEVVMVNSHDGTSTYQLSAGIFELVCANGLIVANAMFGCLRVRHTGDANAILGASYEILEAAPKLLEQVDAMRQVQLTEGERKQFALGGAMLRYGFDKLEDCPIRYERLLEPRRDQDRADDLYTTLNVVQENLMKGRQNIRLGETHVSESGRLVRPVRTKAVKAVDATVKVNKGVWEMAGELLKAKKG